MCGRFATQTLTWQEIVELCNITSHQPPANLPPRYNIAPRQTILVARDTEQHRELAPMLWWLIPHWAKEPVFQYSMFNAKVEGIANKPAFHGPIRYRRCLIPATNFYEWAGSKGSKTPYSIRLIGGEPFCFAGIWDHWSGRLEGRDGDIDSACILTCPSNALVQAIHNRMPVILKRKDQDVWMRGSLDEALEVARPYPAEDMEAFPVSKAIGNVRHEGPERDDLVKPTGDVIRIGDKPE